MHFELSRGDKARLLKWAAEAGDAECCGLIFGRRNHAEKLELTPNISADPARHFEIDPARLIAAEKAERSGGLPLAGYFHSHPNGRVSPSQYDTEMAYEDGRIWLIIANEDITAWRYQGPDGFEPVALRLHQ